VTTKGIDKDAQGDPVTIDDFVSNYTGAHGFDCRMCYPRGWPYPQARNSEPHDAPMPANPANPTT
jgi:hypothetical protein